MADILPSDQSAQVGSGAKNVSFGIPSDNIESKVLVIGTPDPLMLLPPNVPIEILNAEHGGAIAGFGYPLERLGRKAFLGNESSTQVYFLPQDETGTVADGEIEWVGAATAGGKIWIRIANDLYVIDVPNLASIEDISNLAIAAINADKSAQVVATQTAVTFETVLTSKAKGLELNNIVISLNTGGQNEVMPAGVTAVITAMLNGTGTPDIDDALNGLGLGDDANGLAFTDGVTAYGLDTATLDKISTWVGEGDEFTGLYSKSIHRPMQFHHTDTDPGAGAFIALKVITDARLQSRGYSIIGCPDEEDMPTEIAAVAAGVMARMSKKRPEEVYAKTLLPGVGGRSLSANRWTRDVSERNNAVASGISPTKVLKDGAGIQLLNVVTLYRPEDVSPTSNGYADVRDLHVLNNIINKSASVFEAEAYTGASIATDVTKVTDPVSIEKAVDLLTIQTTMNNLAVFFAGKLWIFDTAFMQNNSKALIRQASNGFDIDLKFQLSGKGYVYNITHIFDINIAA